MLRKYKNPSSEKLPKIELLCHQNINPLDNTPPNFTLEQPTKNIRLPILGSTLASQPLTNVQNGRISIKSQLEENYRYFASVPREYHERPKIVALFREFINTFLESQDFFTQLRLTQIYNICKHSQPITLFPEKTDKITLMFDLDQTLIRSNMKRHAFGDTEVRFKGSANTKVSTINIVYVSFRPHLQEMLQKLAESGQFQLGIFTASNKVYANPIIKLIDPDNKYFQHKLYRQHCSVVAGDVYAKDLRRLKNRNLQRMLLIDNSPYSFINKRNSVPIVAYNDDEGDRQLLNLADYLLKLDKNGIVEANQQYFSGIFSSFEYR